MNPDISYNMSNKRVYINQLYCFLIDMFIGYRFLLTRGPLSGAPAIRVEDLKKRERDAEGQKTAVAFKPSDADKTQRMVGRLPSAGLFHLSKFWTISR